MTQAWAGCCAAHSTGTSGGRPAQPEDLSYLSVRELRESGNPCRHGDRKDPSPRRRPALARTGRACSASSASISAGHGKATNGPAGRGRGWRGPGGKRRFSRGGDGPRGGYPAHPGRAWSGAERSRRPAGKTRIGAGRYNAAPGCRNSRRCPAAPARATKCDDDDGRSREEQRRSIGGRAAGTGQDEQRSGCANR